MMNITVCGTGYVGLVAAVAFALKGNRVVGFDTDARKVELLQGGTPPLFEPGIAEALAEAGESLSFTASAEEAYADAEMVFIAVPTPELASGNANLSYVEAALDDLVSFGGNVRFAVMKSTVPPGTSRTVQRALDERLAPQGRSVEVISNPEFLSQGTALRDMMHPARVIVGAQSPEAEDAMLALYEPFDCPVLVMDLESAEMVKYASNDFLALKISYINEIANLCEVVGANVEDVAAGMGADPRIGGSFLRAGIGYGGSCFPKDAKALHWLSAAEGREIKTIKAAIEVNKEQKLSLVAKARARRGSLRGCTVAVLGLTFKPGTDDLRDAPSLDVVEVLLEEGASLRLYDPCGMENFKRVFPEGGQVAYAESALAALDGADLAFLLTEWDEIASIPEEEFAERMATPEIYDGRNMYAVDSFVDPAVRYVSVGRPAVGWEE